MNTFTIESLDEVLKGYLINIFSSENTRVFAMEGFMYYIKQIASSWCLRVGRLNTFFAYVKQQKVKPNTYLSFFDEHGNCCCTIRIVPQKILEKTLC